MKSILTCRRENVTFFKYIVSKLLSALNDTKEADHTCIACSIGHLPSALDYRLVGSSLPRTVCMVSRELIHTVERDPRAAAAAASSKNKLS